MEEILNTIIWAAIIQGIILGSIYLFSKKHRSLANRLLGFFLYALMTEAMAVFISLEQVAGFSIIEYFTTPETKIFWPVLFFHYVLEKLGISHKFRRFLRFNYILAFAILALTPVNIMIYIITGLSYSQLVDHLFLDAVFMVQQYYAFLIAIYAVTVSIRETLRYRKLALEEYSDLDMLQIKWLWEFIFTLVPIILLWGLELGRILLGGRGESRVVLITWGLLVLFIYYVSYKAFRHPNLFEGVNRIGDGEPGAPQAEVVLPKDRSGNGPTMSDLVERLNREMQDQKFYRNHNLTLHDLSRSLEISARSISNCLNRNLGTSFSDWVNAFRVEEALARLKDPAHQHFTIEGIGSDAGFKSRSAMYAAFKRRTGQTPGQLRDATLS